MGEDFFLARPAGTLTGEGLYGKRCAALDLNELFKSEKIHCRQCQVREKTVQDESGEKRSVREDDHQAVALSWVSGQIRSGDGENAVSAGGQARIGAHTWKAMYEPTAA